MACLFDSSVDRSYGTVTWTSMSEWAKHSVLAKTLY